MTPHESPREAISSEIEIPPTSRCLLRELRRFLTPGAFWEVQPPCLSRDCVVDAYIDPIEVPSEQFRLGFDLPRDLFLQTPPESAMKRMLGCRCAIDLQLGAGLSGRRTG